MIPVERPAQVARDRAAEPGVRGRRLDHAGVTTGDQHERQQHDRQGRVHGVAQRRAKDHEEADHAPRDRPRGDREHEAERDDDRRPERQHAHGLPVARRPHEHDGDHEHAAGERRGVRPRQRARDRGVAGRGAQADLDHARDDEGDRHRDRERDDGDRHRDGDHQARYLAGRQVRQREPIADVERRGHARHRGDHEGEPGEHLSRVAAAAREVVPPREPDEVAEPGRPG